MVNSLIPWFVRIEVFFNLIIMEEKIYIFDNTKLSKTETSNYTFKELTILNPKLLEEIFNSNNKYRLTEEAIKSLCKIKDSKIKQKILKLDNERKNYTIHGNIDTLPDLMSSTDLKGGNFKKTQSSYVLYGIRTGF